MTKHILIWETEFKAMLWKKDLKALIELLVETRAHYDETGCLSGREERELDLIVAHMNDEFHILLNGKLFEGKNIP